MTLLDAWKRVQNFRNLLLNQNKRELCVVDSPPRNGIPEMDDVTLGRVLCVLLAALSCGVCVKLGEGGGNYPSALIYNTEHNSLSHTPASEQPEKKMRNALANINRLPISGCLHFNGNTAALDWCQLQCKAREVRHTLILLNGLTAENVFVALSVFTTPAKRLCVFKTLTAWQHYYCNVHMNAYIHQCVRIAEGGETRFFRVLSWRQRFHFCLWLLLMRAAYVCHSTRHEFAPRCYFGMFLKPVSWHLNTIK